MITLPLLLSVSMSLQAQAADSADIFAHPEKYVGKRVTLCGYFHDHFEDFNVWPSNEVRKAGGAGLGFIPATDPSAETYDKQRACVSGVIVKTDCGGHHGPPLPENEVAKVCTWSSYDYALDEQPRS